MAINVRPELVGTVEMGTGSPDGITETYITLSSPSGNIMTLSATATGTWDGATLAFEVSNDNQNWFQATDTLGNDLSITSDGGMTLIDEDHSMTYLYARLAVSGGGGSDDITVVVAGGRG